MSLRIAPPTTHPSETSNTSTGTGSLSLPYPSKGAPSAPGLPDTLRNNLTQPAARGSPSSTSSTTTSTHPLEARLLAWRQTQDALKMESFRRVYGIAEPVRRGMEMKIVRDGTFRPALLSKGGASGATVHEDILAIGGRDTEIGWEDVFHGDEFREPPAFHDEMEKRLRMDW